MIFRHFIIDFHLKSKYAPKHSQTYQWQTYPKHVWGGTGVFGVLKRCAIFGVLNNYFTKAPNKLNMFDTGVDQAMPGSCCSCIPYTSVRCLDSEQAVYSGKSLGCTSMSSLYRIGRQCNNQYKLLPSRKNEVVFS